MAESEKKVISTTELCKTKNREEDNNVNKDNVNNLSWFVVLILF